MEWIEKAVLMFGFISLQAKPAPPSGAPLHRKTRPSAASPPMSTHPRLSLARWRTADAVKQIALLQYSPFSWPPHGPMALSAPHPAVWQDSSPISSLLGLILVPEPLEHRPMELVAVPDRPPGPLLEPSELPLRRSDLKIAAASLCCSFLSRRLVFLHLSDCSAARACCIGGAARRAVASVLCMLTIGASNSASCLVDKLCNNTKRRRRQHGHGNLLQF